MKFLRILLIAGCTAVPAAAAHSAPVVWEFSGVITRSTPSPDLDPGIRGGAVISGRLEMDPEKAVLQVRYPAEPQDPTGVGPCGDTDYLCFYQLPGYLTVSIGDHHAEGPVKAVSVHRNDSLYFTIDPFTYDGTAFSFRDSGISLTFGYGQGLRANVLPAPTLELPPQGYSHTFGISFNFEGVIYGFPHAAGTITNVGVVPEATPPALLLVSLAILSWARGRRDHIWPDS